MLSKAIVIIGGAYVMNNKLVDSHLGSDMSISDIDNDMSNVLKRTIYGRLTIAKNSKRPL